MLDTLLIIGGDGGDTETSIILSVIIASSCRVDVAGVEASTIRTLLGL